MGCPDIVLGNLFVRFPFLPQSTGALSSYSVRTSLSVFVGSCVLFMVVSLGALVFFRKINELESFVEMTSGNL